MIIDLPSGAKLDTKIAPFEDSKNLWQALLEEAKTLKINSNDPMEDLTLLKDIFCMGLSSKKIEAMLWKCIERSTYNSMKIDRETFEPVDARQDYAIVCFEVARENILPFTKSLTQKYSQILAMMKSSLK